MYIAVGSVWSKCRRDDNDLAGSVSSETFAQWWLFEDRANHLTGFLEQHFPGTLQLERPGISWDVLGLKLKM